jgi:hypothetical protein
MTAAALFPVACECAMLLGLRRATRHVPRIPIILLLNRTKILSQSSQFLGSHVDNSCILERKVHCYLVIDKVHTPPPLYLQPPHHHSHYYSIVVLAANMSESSEESSWLRWNRWSSV